MLVMPGLHLENIFSYILFLYKKFVTEKRTQVKTRLTVLLSTPFNKLPCSKSGVCKSPFFKQFFSQVGGKYRLAIDHNELAM